MRDLLRSILDAGDYWRSSVQHKRLPRQWRYRSRIHELANNATSAARRLAIARSNEQGAGSLNARRIADHEGLFTAIPATIHHGLIKTTEYPPTISPPTLCRILSTWASRGFKFGALA